MMTGEGVIGRNDCTLAGEKMGELQCRHSPCAALYCLPAASSLANDRTCMHHTLLRPKCASHLARTYHDERGGGDWKERLYFVWREAG